jgi:hypothetical protein
LNAQHTNLQVHRPNAFSRTYDPLLGQKEARFSLCSIAIAHDWRQVERRDISADFSSSRKQEPFVLLPAPSNWPCKASSTYKERLEEWTNLYTSVDTSIETSVESLRKRFGTNHNRFWGDLDAKTARRLYKTLLPSTILPLVQTGVKPQDLAPLAYQARVAAKLYIRERSRVPARIAATLFDGFRQFRRYGRFNTHGMTYEQVWQKYRKVILDDYEKEGSSSGLTEEDVAAQICVKILEKSCSTNRYIDRLFASRRDQELGEELNQISEILEADIRRLLDPIVNGSPPSDYQIRRFQTLKKVARSKRRILGKPMKRQKRSRTDREI